MANKQKLELTWIGKDARPKLEPRILLEDPLRSYHAKFRSAGVSPANAGGTPALQDVFDNKLIFGDNLPTLEALSGLVQQFA